MEEKLRGIMDHYLSLLTTNDPSKLPISPHLKVTENGYPIDLGQGLFETAQEITFRQYITAPLSDQIALLGVAKETMLLSNFMVRIGVEGDNITEIETIVARKGTSSIASPETMKEPKPIYDQTLDADQRSTREQMISIANSYFEGIEQNTGAMVPFHPDCNRTANGQQTTNIRPVKLSCQEQFDKKIFSYINRVRNRRFLIINQEKGLVFGVFLMDVLGRRQDFELFPIPMDKLPAHMYTPHTILLSELFKIVNGQIREIEALMINTTLGASSGWPDHDFGQLDKDGRRKAQCIPGRGRLEA